MYSGSGTLRWGLLPLSGREGTLGSFLSASWREAVGGSLAEVEGGLSGRPAGRLVVVTVEETGRESDVAGIAGLGSEAGAAITLELNSGKPFEVSVVAGLASIGAVLCSPLGTTGAVVSGLVA